MSRWLRDPRVLLGGAAVGLFAAAIVFALVASGGDEPEAGFAPVRAAPVPYDGRSPRVPAGDEQRVLVSLARPSLGEKAAQRERAGLTPLTPRSQRRYVRSLRREGVSLRSALDARGVRLRSVVAFERTINGFAATIRTRDLAAVSSLGARARPVRRFFPAGSEPVAVNGASAGADGPAARTIGPVALLDTGVDLGHPDLRGRVTAGADTVSGDRDPAPGRDPRARDRLETHGTALAGVLVAAGVEVRAYRVAGLQPVESGGAQAFATTDQLLAGLERAVDPDGDGDTEDAPALALAGVSAPYAGFAGAPEAQAAEGAAALGMLVIAPAGEEGAATGPNGVIGSPGAAPAALAVGAAVRESADVARVEVSLGDAVRIADAAVLSGPAPVLRGGDARTSRPVIDTDPRALLGQIGAGQVAVVRAGGERNPAAQAAAAAAAGAVAVLVCDSRDDATLPALPAGRVPVPVLGLTGAAARAVLAAPPGQPVSTGDVEAPASTPAGTMTLAPASSHGPALDGTPKPDLAADGAALAPLPGGGAGLIAGSSVAAARAAVVAAQLLDKEPDLPPAQILARLRGFARPAPGLPASGAGAGLLTAVNDSPPAPAPTPAPTGTPPPPPRIGTPELLRRGEETVGVRFALGEFRRGDAARGGATQRATRGTAGADAGRRPPPRRGPAPDAERRRAGVAARGVRVHACQPRPQGAGARPLRVPDPRLGPAPRRAGGGALARVRRPMTRVTLYTRPGCHLCDDARAAIERVRTTRRFELEEIDIESDDALHRAYLERIPVVCVDGEEVFEYFVDETALARLLHARED